MNAPGAARGLRSPRRGTRSSRGLARRGARRASRPRAPVAGRLLGGALGGGRGPRRGGLAFQVQDEAAQLVTLFAAGDLAGRRRASSTPAPRPAGRPSTSPSSSARGRRWWRSSSTRARPTSSRARGRAARPRRRVRVVCADAAQPIPGLEAGSFDAVLVDAPCAGLGTLRRHPELKLRRAAARPRRAWRSSSARILADLAPRTRARRRAGTTPSARSRARRRPEIAARCVAAGLAPRAPPPPGFPAERCRRGRPPHAPAPPRDRRLLRGAARPPSL